jgi:hypothetical protein
VNEIVSKHHGERDEYYVAYEIDFSGPVVDFDREHRAGGTGADD